MRFELTRSSPCIAEVFFFYMGGLYTYNITYTVNFRCYTSGNKSREMGEHETRDVTS